MSAALCVAECYFCEWEQDFDAVKPAWDAQRDHSDATGHRTQAVMRRIYHG